MSLNISIVSYQYAFAFFFLLAYVQQCVTCIIYTSKKHLKSWRFQICSTNYCATVNYNFKLAPPWLRQIATTKPATALESTNLISYNTSTSETIEELWKKLGRSSKHNMMSCQKFVVVETLERLLILNKNHFL